MFLIVYISFALSVCLAHIFFTFVFIYPVLSELEWYVGEFDDILDSSSGSLSDLSEKINLVYYNIQSSPSIGSNGSVPPDMCRKLMDIQNLTLKTPTSRATLVRDLSLEIREKDHLLASLFESSLFQVIY